MLLDICRNRDGAWNDDFELSWNVGQKIFMFLKNLTNILAIYITPEEINGGMTPQKSPLENPVRKLSWWSKQRLMPHNYIDPVGKTQIIATLWVPPK